MKIYSETIFSFIDKCEKYLKEIITKETPFELKRSRFKYKNYTYPIHLVVFTDSNSLGYFDRHTFQIGLHESIMYQAKDHVLKNILRHELAHYICFIEGNECDKPHGDSFKEVCQRLGWEEQVKKAAIDIEIENNFEGNLESEKTITRVKALLSLAQSDNKHEAELATLKANQLLLKYNISNLNTSNEKTYTKSVLTYKKRNSKMSAIYEILKHFLVKPVFTYGHKQVSLEVSGSKENIELALYVSDFLEKELEKLWNEAKNLSGLRAKNSFFHGVARGYDDKINMVAKEFTRDEQKALIVLNDQLDIKVQRIYRRLSSSSSGSSIDSNAFSKGKITGKNLTINNAIKNKTKTALLGWR